MPAPKNSPKLEPPTMLRMRHVSYVPTDEKLDSPHICDHADVPRTRFANAGAKEDSGGYMLRL